MHEDATGKIGTMDYDLNNKDVKCPYCGDLLTNLQVSRGNKYCNSLCVSRANIAKFNNSKGDEYLEGKMRLSKSRSENLSNKWKDQSYRDARSEVLSEQAARLKESGQGIHSYEAFANNACSHLINSESDTLYYYKAYYSNLDGYFKLGVSSDPNKRSSIEFHDSIKDVECILKGPKMGIAKLELDTKLKFAKQNWDATGRTEAFNESQYDEILEFINNYVEGSTTIEKITN